MLSYIDNLTFSNWPTGLDVSQIVPAGTNAQESAALTQVLAHASSWVDHTCKQRVAATEDSEQKRLRPNAQGQLEVFSKNFPIIALLQAKWIDLSDFGSSSWTTIDVTKAMPLERSFVIYDADYTAWRSMGAPPLIVQYQYENGYAHTTLTGPGSGTSTVVPASSATIQVASTIGVGTTTAGSAGWNLQSELTILDGQNTETVEVTGISGTTLTLASPTVYQHNEGVLVTAVPELVREAAILAACWMIKNPRGDGSFTMPSSGAPEPQKGGSGSPDTTLLDSAREMLRDWTRVL